MKKVYLVVEYIFYTDEKGIEQACVQNDTDLHIFSSKKKAKKYFETTMEVYDIKSTEVNMFPYTWFEKKAIIADYHYRTVVALKEIEVI